MRSRAIARTALPACSIALGTLLLAAHVSGAQAAGDLALGAHLASECTTCHQTSGRQQAGIPAIIGWPEDQFVALMAAYRDKMRDNQVMQTIAARLNDDEVAALATYFGSLKPSN